MSEAIQWCVEAYTMNKRGHQSVTRMSACALSKHRYAEAEDVAQRQWSSPDRYGVFETLRLKMMVMALRRH